jgi:hypothetical protein
MKETLIIEGDVLAALEQFRRDRNATLEEVVNEALRRGLREMEAQPKPRMPFRTMSVDCGTPLIANIDNVAEVLAVIEGEDYK